MRILLAAIHYPVASGRFYARAFRRLGHDVRTIGPAMGNEIWGMTVDPRWVWKPDYESAYDIPDDWKPDLAITCDSALNLDFSYLTDHHIVIGVDNHVRDYRNITAPVNAMFLCHSWGNRIEEPGAYWLPAGYDPEVHRDHAQERDITIGMMAVPYPDRWTMVDEFGAGGLSVASGIGLLWDDYAGFYNRVKIALVKSVCGDLTQRFFECMAMGCCVLADHTVDADKLGFVPYRDYIPYIDTPDAIAKAKELLASGRWHAIAVAGYEAVRPHTWDNRALEVLRRVDALKYAKDLTSQQEPG